MIRIAIVDDDDTDAARTAEMIERYYAEREDESRGTAAEHDARSGTQSHPAYTITRFTDGESFLDDYKAEFDAMFLDVEMPGIDGLETAHRLREIDSHVVLVFTTKMAQYAAVGYDVDAIGYLVKPIDYFGFALKMRKVEDLVAKRQGVTIPLTVGTGTQFLSSHDVRYVEVLGHEVIYHTERVAYKVWSSLKEAAALLEPVHFAASNRYCLVNLEWVQAVNGDTVVVDGQTLPVSRSKRKPLMQALAAYYGR
ncbi:LytR/AlgR family response regulator transcription factor [Bifidobacterium miconisargentati]|uniref:LytR/AlgR family response regulator transcription factor n=1 Tax=Bifidobacterium miconisargentati TaxID=2834437 RepID=UPI001BDBBDF0|nr:LytTR family DNA-binding domain-containing protein [Bifidobacterium miconisargentati]MBW3090349.1 response regulator transcription factor [Bifidobacterium miconisargentati]